jgi:uncharacterized lipoprotein YmbA
MTGLMLSACGRSPDSQFYVLNPITAHPMQMKNYRHLRIGINEIQGPTYFSKPQFIIHYSVQEVKLEEFHRWIGDLGKNVKQVIEVNLKTLLPGVALVSAPWDPKFNPAYQLGIDILRFEVDINGNSDLSVDYIVYNDKKLYKKGTFVYHKKVVLPKVENLVASMNENLNQFTRDLANVLASLN